MMRITYVGAAFLAVVAIIPSLISAALDVELHGRQLLRRHRPADRHQRRPRPGAEDQQPPGHAELSGPDGGLMRSHESRSARDSVRAGACSDEIASLMFPASVCHSPCERGLFPQNDHALFCLDQRDATQL